MISTVSVNMMQSEQMNVLFSAAHTRSAIHIHSIQFDISQPASSLCKWFRRFFLMGTRRTKIFSAIASSAQSLKSVRKPELNQFWKQKYAATLVGFSARVYMINCKKFTHRKSAARTKIAIMTKYFVSQFIISVLITFFFSSRIIQTPLSGFFSSFGRVFTRQFSVFCVLTRDTLAVYILFIIIFVSLSSISTNMSRIVTSIPDSHATIKPYS